VTQYVGSMLMCAVSRAHLRALSPTICARCGRLLDHRIDLPSACSVNVRCTLRVTVSVVHAMLSSKGYATASLAEKCSVEPRRTERSAHRVPAECAPDAQSRKCAAMRRAAVIQRTNPLQDLQCTRAAETRLRPTTMTMFARGARLQERARRRQRTGDVRRDDCPFGCRAPCDPRCRSLRQCAWLGSVKRSWSRKGILLDTKLRRRARACLSRFLDEVDYATRVLLQSPEEQDSTATNLEFSIADVHSRTINPEEISFSCPKNHSRRT
jgi:hypothetical protein